MSGRRQSDHHHNNNNHNNNNNNHHSQSSSQHNKNHSDHPYERKFKNTSDQCSLLIENITDPETYKDFEKEVKTCGMTTKFWINKRSRTCVVTFCEQDDAISAFTQFTKIYWPDNNIGERMRVKLIENVDVSDVITKIQLSQNITRPEQDAFKEYKQPNSNRNEDHDRRKEKRYSSERNSSRDRQKDNKDNKDKDRDRSDRDRSNKQHKNYDKYKKKSPFNNRSSNDRYESQKDTQILNKSPSNFQKTIFQPSVYYSIQPEDVVNSRKLNIESHFKK